VLKINHNFGAAGEKPRQSVFITSPAYSGDVNCKFVASLLQTIKIFEQNDIDYEVYFSVFDSLVARSRNDLTNKFLESKCTHVLMIDSDQGWDPKAPFEMLKTGKEFITGAVPGRKTEETYAIKINVDENRRAVVEDGLISCASNGVAFALIEREVFKVIEHNKPSVHTPYPFFQHRYFENGDHYGEDTYFVNEWLKVGGKVWIYPDITFSHGPITANYHKFLCRQPGGSEHVKEPTKDDTKDKILEFINGLP
jgi:hypothetical protein